MLLGNLLFISLAFSKVNIFAATVLLECTYYNDELVYLQTKDSNLIIAAYLYNGGWVPWYMAVIALSKFVGQTKLIY